MSLELAKKVLEVVDAGLVGGIGVPEPGKMCVEAAVCYAMGLPHGDNPTCVSPALRRLKIGLNDSRWSSSGARAKGMRRLAIAQLGSAGVLDDVEFVKRCAALAIRVSVPEALRAAAALLPSPHKENLLGKALLCEENPTQENARAANAATDAANAAAGAAAYADAAAAYAAAAYADAAAAYADAAAAYAADAAACAADAAACAADAAACAADAADESLSRFAEAVVQILVDMKAPGCEYLFLTEGGVK